MPEHLPFVSCELELQLLKLGHCDDAIESKFSDKGLHVLY